jgi:hypothetical protein
MMEKGDRMKLFAMSGDRLIRYAILCAAEVCDDEDWTAWAVNWWCDLDRSTEAATAAWFATSSAAAAWAAVGAEAANGAAAAASAAVAWSAALAADESKRVNIAIDLVELAEMAMDDRY